MRLFSSPFRLLALSAVAALVAVMLLLLPTPRAVAQTPAPGKIDGQLVEGTKDSQLSLTNGLTVTLHMLPAGATASISQTAQTDANGHFAFSNLDTITTTRYLLIANYSGVDYYSDVLTFEPNQTTLPVTLTVYETTIDPASVHVTQTHLVFDVQTRLFGVLQIIAAQNNTDRTYIGATSVGPHRVTLSLPVPAGAQDIQFDNPAADASTLRGDTVMTYTLPLMPGSNQIVYNYSLPFNPPTYDLNLKLPYDTDRFRILISDVGATIQSSQLSPPAPFPAPGGQKYVLSSADNLKAGTVVKATFTNLPATVAAPPPGSGNAPSDAASNDRLQLIGGVVLGVAGLAALALLLYPLARQRGLRRAPAPVDNRRLDLLQEMADLDDAFEAHQISEPEYRERRNAAKAQLLELAQADERGGSGDPE
jgi:hypothetical protein